MEKHRTALLISLGCLCLAVACNNTNGPLPPRDGIDPEPEILTEMLLFSEYVEGSSNNKALEISNVGTAPVDLSRCRLEIYANGGTVPSYALSLNGGFLEPSAAFVAAHSAFAEPARADLLSSWVNFNGDDAIVLILDDSVVDSIGRIGEDPGDAWLGTFCSTQNATLRRKPTDLGDTDALDPFDPDVAWNPFPIDDFSDLGS